MNNDYSGVKLPNGDVLLFEGNGIDNGNYIDVEPIDGINTIEETASDNEETTSYKEETETNEVQVEETESEVTKVVEENSSFNSVLIDVNGNDVNYFQYSYIEQVKTNLYLQMILILIPSILILKWLYGGIKKIFHVSI